MSLTLSSLFLEILASLWIGRSPIVPNVLLRLAGFPKGVVIGVTWLDVVARSEEIAEIICIRQVHRAVVRLDATDVEITKSCVVRGDCVKVVRINRV